MDVRPVAGAAPHEKRKGFYFFFYEQWSALFDPSAHSWLDFTFLQLEFENCKYSGRVELVVGLLGVTFTLGYIYDDTFNRVTSDMLRDLDLELNRECDDGRR